jgi:hypothetical protein
MYRAAALIAVAATWMMLVAASSSAQPRNIAPDAAPGSAVNPMTGESESMEQMRARLGQLQMQARMEVELTNIERSRQERRRLANTDALPVVAPAPVARPPVAHAKPAQQVASQAPSAPTPPPSTGPSAADPKLVGTITDNEASMALIDVGGRVLTLIPGQATDGVAVGSVARDSVVVNGLVARLPPTVGRLALPAAPDTAGANGRFLGLSLGPAPAGSVPAGSVPAAPQLPQVLLPLGSKETAW